MDSPFKLLAYAIFALALIFVVYSYFLPLLSQPSDLGKEISDGFELAKANEGVVSEGKDLFLKPVQSVFAKNFDDISTIAVLKCNNPQFCCVDEKECKSALDINSQARSLTVRENTRVKTFYRCMYDKRLFVCMAFFGQKPAQLKIKQLGWSKSLNLNNGSQTNITIQYTNAGGVKAFEKPKIKIQVFNAKDNNPLKEPVFETEQEAEALGLNELKIATVPITISFAGVFDVKVLIESEEAGRDYKIVQINASGIPSTECSATFKQAPETYDSSGSITELRGKCVSKALCEKCLTSFECRNSWLSQEANVVSAGSDYAYIIESDEKCFPNPAS